MSTETAEWTIPVREVAQFALKVRRDNSYCDPGFAGAMMRLGIWEAFTREQSSTAVIRIDIPVKVMKPGDYYELTNWWDERFGTELPEGISAAIGAFIDGEAQLSAGDCSPVWRLASIDRSTRMAVKGDPQPGTETLDVSGVEYQDSYGPPLRDYPELHEDDDGYEEQDEEEEGEYCEACDEYH